MAIHAVTVSLLAAAFAVLLQGACAAGMPDIERGRALYDNHCIACHGQSVHARPGRSPPTHAELRDIIRQWQKAEGLSWSEEEVRDVTAFLELVVYRR